MREVGADRLSRLDEVEANAALGISPLDQLPATGNGQLGRKGPEMQIAKGGNQPEGLRESDASSFHDKPPKNCDQMPFFRTAKVGFFKMPQNKAIFALQNANF